MSERDAIECPTCHGSGKLQVGQQKGVLVYPPVDSIWQDNDPRMRLRRVKIVAHYPEEQRVAVRNVGGNRLTYIAARSFGKRGRSGFRQVSGLLNDE